MTNEPTVYDFIGGLTVRTAALKMGARSTYSTKKIEFFVFPNGRKFLLEPDRASQVNLGFPPGLEGQSVRNLGPQIGKNSNVKSHWRLKDNHFSKLEVAEVSANGMLSVAEAIEILENLCG
ncbi:hypothetical protein BZU93_26530 [Salmonella enterica subsp. enterica]|nr:hypothetical protein [Salmonella enterica subsp. enterica serovar Enteritidis]MIL09416.1 hypothetical protein [Salmonella enterica subsp. enterica serovar Enteritidis]